MAPYLHGVYGVAESSSYEAVKSLTTLPVYIGSLPIQRVNKTGAGGFDYTPYINKPILISSYRDVKELGIYSEDWDAYTLGEAIRVHFMNSDNIVAPIVFINTLDPSLHLKAEAVTETVNLKKEGTSYVGVINDPLCSLDDMAITADGVEFAEGELSYAYDGDAVKISIKKDGFTATSVTASYKQIEFSAKTFTVTEFKKAVDAVDYVEQIAGLVPTILCAPAFSKIPALHDLMVQKVIDRAAEKWNMVCLSDIPASAEVNTYEKAIEWKNTNQYGSKYDKPCWPRGSNGGYMFHLSTITAFTMQLTDIENDGIPYVSPSNKVIDIDKIVLDDGTVLYIKESEANKLNEVGITTVNFIKQTMRLWGSHMANYNHANVESILPEDRFDVTVRMAGFILNHLQYNYIDEIDESFTPKDIDSLVNSIQTWFDSLVEAGALLYATITFDGDANPTDNLANGDILFDINVTYPVIAKSLTFRLQWTKAGLSLLTEGSEA